MNAKILSAGAGLLVFGGKSLKEMALQVLDGKMLALEWL